MAEEPTAASTSSTSATEPARCCTSRRVALFDSAALAALLGVATTTTTTIPNGAAWAAYIDPSTDMPKITARAYLDVKIGDDGGSDGKGRIVVGLFGEAMPRATENFLRLCKSNAYAGTNFYRVLSNYTIQGGAIGDATGKTSNSESFEPDNYNIKHTIPGLVSCVRSGVGGTGGSADSRFFVNTVGDAMWADDRYAAFGVVEPESMDFILSKIDKVKVKPPQNRPIVDVDIVESGVL